LIIEAGHVVDVMFFEPKISPVRRSIAAQLKKPSVASETVVALKTGTTGVGVGVGVGVGEAEAAGLVRVCAAGVVPDEPCGQASQITSAEATRRTPATPAGQASADQPRLRRGLPRCPGTRAGRWLGRTGAGAPELWVEGTDARPTCLGGLGRSSIGTVKVLESRGVGVTAG
jgi:hypothetical protein